MKDFRTLKVWQKSHRIVLEIYRCTGVFPSDERYGLIRQMRSASVSVAANISEGCCRKGDAELSRFLQVSMGSASELEYYCILASDLGMLSLDHRSCLSSGIMELKKMIASFLRRLKADR